MLIIHTLKFVRLLNIINFAFGKSWIRQNNPGPIFIKGSDPIKGFEHTFAVAVVKIKNQVYIDIHDILLQLGTLFHILFVCAIAPSIRSQ